MDFSSNFQNIIVSKSFLTFESFQESLNMFTQITGNQFAIKKRMRHKTNAPMRQQHMFRYVTYACICALSTECEAFFHIESKGKCIRVTQFYMVHNHEVIYNPAFTSHGIDDENGYDVQCDLTGEFEEMFPVKFFDTFDEFWTKLKAFQAKTGSIYIKHNACKWPADAIEKQHLVYKVVKIECVHYGRHEYKKTNQPNIKMSCKIGCRSCIRVTSGRGRVAIGKFCMKHNHPVPIESAIQYPPNTLLSENEKRNSEYHVLCDVTTEFVEAFASGRFSTYDDFLARLSAFQKETGCFYSKRNSDLWPAEAADKEHLKYKFAIFDCVHYGYTQNSKKRRNTQRRAGFCFRNKFGCKSTLRISTAKGYVEILNYEMRHNHPPSEVNSSECPPQAWLLSGISVGDGEKVSFKRRRHVKKRSVSFLDLTDSISSLSTGKAGLIRPQLEKLHELAISASAQNFALFSSQLAQFESHWRGQLKKHQAAE